MNGLVFHAPVNQRINVQSESENKGAGRFQVQSYQDQLTIVWQRGILLEARRLPGFWLHLYAVDTFFVEMWVCQRRYDVSLLRVLANTDELAPYLDKVVLDHLAA